MYEYLYLSCVSYQKKNFKNDPRSPHSLPPSYVRLVLWPPKEAVENERAREIRQTNLAKTEVIPLRQGSGEGRTKHVVWRAAAWRSIKM
jgi:hypothetical protein